MLILSLTYLYVMLLKNYFLFIKDIISSSARRGILSLIYFAQHLRLFCHCLLHLFLLPLLLLPLLLLRGFRDWNHYVICFLCKPLDSSFLFPGTSDRSLSLLARVVPKDIVAIGFGLIFLNHNEEQIIICLIYNLLLTRFISMRIYRNDNSI